MLLMEHNSSEEIFVVKVRVVYGPGEPTYVQGAYLRRYFLENKLQDGDIAHVPASKLKNFNPETRAKFEAPYIANPNDLKTGENRLFWLDGSELGLKIYIICWLINIKNTKRVCKKTV